ncbi:TIGR03773 family transporter-associated surface protein [Streptomyces sp. NPDC092296]|uniref:TIGR03773 family transporter-associated surface protein n=1 Tax=Streptomyces sp. NPDC092296 TaxID=3366012 RepID=UPI0037FEABAA
MTLRRARALTAVLLLTGCVLTVGPTAASAAEPTPPPATGRTVLAEGHLDLGPRLDHGHWTIGIRDDSGAAPVWRDPADVVLQAVQAAAVTVPADQRFSFLGRPGARVWLLPQVQQDGVLWPGWNSQDPSILHLVDREVTWQLESVRGPGRFVLFLNGSFGTPQILFDSAEPLPQETGIEVDSHVHGNWAFTRPGSYQLGIRMTARSTAGAHYDGRAVLRLSVGSQDPQRAFAPAATPAAQAPPAPAAPESQAAGSQAPESQAAGSQAPESQAPESQAAGSHTAGGHGGPGPVLVAGAAAAAAALAAAAWTILARTRRTTPEAAEQHSE